MSENKGKLIDKVKDFATEIKTHWDTPAEGKYVPYKEYKDIVFAVGSNYAGSKTLEYISFASPMLSSATFLLSTERSSVSIIEFL